MHTIESVENELKQLRLQINTHPLYKTLASMEDIKIFMEKHVFAVWDFMSLLKALQNHLTNTNVPWTPKSNATTARFINEIVMGEESDVNEIGEAKSHYEMYLDAMDQIGAKTTPIKQFTKHIKNGKSLHSAAQLVGLSSEIYDFIAFTMKVVNDQKPYSIASAFTFGREDVIPDMFFEIIQQSSANNDHPKYSKLLYYLNRHIEIDGDEHGPISLKMVEELCANDQQKWEEVLETAKQALDHRIKLWDHIQDTISNTSIVN